ncbi:MAG TPA: gluconate:H+ symporter [Kiritimatiellia bacterium]|nr:gluconate:H+ symporter [Kiritimatiellia bacterium]HPC48499.1 gluconate:H+ symporter [Kiritimatiellia bacterium]HPK37720.1 gluconate:H+ symporter [Kiritimatiellia bacterium]HRU18753.1 gluconate:H+ symporter [Kiritimatiellia bacterium]
MIASPVYLASVVALAVAVLLILIIRLKQQPFVSLLLVSMGTALAAGMPPEKVIACIEKGMGGTLGFIAVVVGLGAMFGQLLEVSGGAERLTLTLLRVFGKERATWAMALAGFLVAIPVFFDVGFIILVPLVYTLSRETKKSLLYYGIPLLAGLAVTHAFVPPTPGPIAVAQLVGADLGRVIFYGVLIGLPCAIVAGPVFGTWIDRRIHAAVPAYMETEAAKKQWDEKALPGFGRVFGILLLPLFLILLNTVTQAVLAEGEYATVRHVFAFIGHPFFALLAATLLAFTFLGTCRGLTREKVNEVATSALAPAGLIILVTGAGGVFKQVLVDSGAGKALAGTLAHTGLHPVWTAFLIALLVRAVAGSATVAMLTAGGIMAPLLAGQRVEPALIVIAIASGATALSHVNDSGFWLVNRYFGLSVKETLRSWTVMETLIGLIGATLAWLFSYVA